MKESRSRYAVLGMLSLRPMSGYDIRKLIGESIGNFWNESYGQIYPILRSLVAEGLATRRSQRKADRPTRNVYELTAKGRAELHRWLAEPIAHEVGRIEILLKLFFGWQMPAAERIAHVERFRALHEGRLEHYAGIERWLAAGGAPAHARPYALITLRYGQHVSRALLAWSDETLQTLRDMAEDSGRKRARRRA